MYKIDRSGRGSQNRILGRTQVKVGGPYSVIFNYFTCSDREYKLSYKGET